MYSSGLLVNAQSHIITVTFKMPALLLSPEVPPVTALL